MNGGTGVDVVDLTDDSPTVRTQPITTTVQPAPVKKRSLPMSVLPPAHGNGMQPVPNRLPLPSISTLPSAVRTLPPSLTVPNGWSISFNHLMHASLLMDSLCCSSTKPPTTQSTHCSCPSQCKDCVFNCEFTSIHCPRRNWNCFSSVIANIQDDTGSQV